MPRKRRILEENGFYHVFNRGICRKQIQFSKFFQDEFFAQLCISVDKYKVQIHAYCLMENHYHFLINTPHANLDKFMQHFASGLSRKINRLLGGDGALFRSRYRSVYVESDHYILQLMKYIHRNPVEASIVDKPENYTLSSYKSYLGMVKSPKWLTQNFLKSLFNNTESIKQFHEVPVPEFVSKQYARVQIPDRLK